MHTFNFTREYNLRRCAVSAMWLSVGRNKAPSHALALAHAHPPVVLQAYARERGVSVEVMGVLFADEDLSKTTIDKGFQVLPILHPNRTAGSYLKSRGLPFGMCIYTVHAHACQYAMSVVLAHGDVCATQRAGMVALVALVALVVVVWLTSSAFDTLSPASHCTHTETVPAEPICTQVPWRNPCARHSLQTFLWRVATHAPAPCIAYSSLSHTP